MKILVIHSPFMPLHINGTNFGGVEAYVDSICRCACDNNHEVTLIATNDSDGEYPNLTMVKTECDSKFELDKHKPNPKATIRFKYEQINALIRKLGLNNFDLVLNNIDKQNVSKFLQYEQERLKVENVVCYIHNPPIFRGSVETAKGFDKFSHNIYVFNSRYNLEAWQGIAKHEHLDNFLSRIRYNPLTISPRGAEVAETINPSNLIAIGRIVEHKNFHILKKIAKENPDLNCHIIGSIVDQDVYDKLITDKPDNLTMHISISNEEKTRLIKELSGFMCSFSCNETYGISAAESFEQGLPLFVVDTSNTNIPYFIKDHPDVRDNATYLVAPIGIMLKRCVKFNKDILFNHTFDPKVIRQYFDSVCRMNIDHINTFYGYITNK